MRNRSLWMLLLFLGGILFAPQPLTERARGLAVASLAPMWGMLLDVKLLLQAPFASWREPEDPQQNLEIQSLRLENQQLRNEMAYLEELVRQDYFVLHEMLDNASLSRVPKEALEMHQNELLHLFKLELASLPARVIYRPLNNWKSSLWIDKGEADNQLLGKKILVKNSPVVVGIAVIGVVDYVGEHQSRIRLISDPGLNPSVRVKRGNALLAKGELRGQSPLIGRSQQSRLMGVGFNYDFPDEEGPARDLRTGEPLEQKSKYPTTPLVQVNDLLVTTGMDGVLPPGLEVGIVKKIQPLKEGDYTYELEADAAAGDLNELSLVFILPPTQLAN